jgi:hypothetical protein
MKSFEPINVMGGLDCWVSFCSLKEKGGGCLDFDFTSPIN